MIDHRIALLASPEAAALAPASRGKDFYAALGRAIKVTRTEQERMQMVPRLERIAEELAEEARADVPGADRR